MTRDEKINRIIEIAGFFITRFGWQKTTMDHIATKSKMAKSTLYYYFKNREAIFEAVIDRDALLLRQRVWTVMADAATPKEKLSKYIFARMAALRKLSNYYSSLTDELLNQYSFVRQERHKFQSFEENTIHHILTEGCAKGIFGIENIQKTCDSIILAMKGMESKLVTQGNPSDGDSLIRNMLDLFFYGIERKK